MVSRRYASPTLAAMSGPAVAPSAVAASVDAATVTYQNGFPDVPRFSSCLEYLELCEEDVFINSVQLDTKLTKIIGGNGKWRHEAEGTDFTALEIVELLREAVAEDQPEINLEEAHVLLEPSDKLRIKKEVAAEDEEEEPERLGMKLAVIDLEPGGDGVPIEVETHDGGPASGQQARPLLHLLHPLASCTQLCML